MRHAIVVRGRMRGPSLVELDEPVAGLDGAVEVVLQPIDADARPADETVFEFLRRLPPGKRTKDEIDQELNAERDSWHHR